MANVLGMVIRAKREELGYNQAAVADRLGVHQATVSSVELGQRCATHAEVAALEAWWKLPRGWIQRRAGLIDDPSTTRDAILGDPDLSREAMEVLIASYDALVKARRSAPRRQRGS